MKIRTIVTEIECNAEEIRQSNNVADGICNLLRNAFNGAILDDEEDDEEEDLTDEDNY